MASALGSVVRNAKMSFDGLAFLDLPDGGPVSPDAGEAGEGARLVEREPDVAAFDLVELAKRVKRHHATVLDAEPAGPVVALYIADVGRPAVRLHSEQFLEVDRLALGLQLSARFLVASINAFDDDGMPHRAVASSRPSAPLRTIGAL
jgi:hypothetical protein